MRTRTTNPNSPKYVSYGGRGISSEEFKYFVDFYDAMYESYLEHISIYGEKETTLERIDVNKDYSKSNCCWKTWAEQAQNKTTTLKYIAKSPDGIIHRGRNLKEFCIKQGLKYDTVIVGLHQGNKTWRNGWHFEIV